MTSVSPAVTDGRHAALAAWLLVCCAMVFAMVILGGVTRLTGSGLSMVEWDPIFGVVPPTTEDQWQSVFDKYRESPEYQKVNVGMDLAGFKRIYWLEYAHRLLGRLIGLVFLIPFLIFVALRKVPRALVPKLVTLFLLGAAQGLLGWYMVKSGLVDNPHVSHYRLTAHLMFAVLIYGYMLWTALGLLYPAIDQPAPAFLRRGALFLLALVAVTMASGGLVAGLKAGLAYNTFPLMDGRLVPDGLMKLEPWYANVFENAATVQFDHRLLALGVFLTAVIVWLSGRASAAPPRVRYALVALLVVAVVQVMLGIATLLLHVPVALGSAHQAGALVVFTVALFILHQVRHSPSV